VAKKGSGGAGHNEFGPDMQKKMRTLEGGISELFDQRDHINTQIAALFKDATDAGIHAPTLRATIQRKRKIDKDPAGFKAKEEQLALYFATLYQGDLFEREPQPGDTAASEPKEEAAAEPADPLLN
jgi:hypothetical protein